MTSPEDKEILEMFHSENGKHKAFSLLVKKYERRIYMTIRRMVYDHDDTNDVMQNVFIKVWHGLENFRADSMLFTWMYRIATNETITFLNNKKRKGVVPLETNEHDEARAYSVADTLRADSYFDGDEVQLKLQAAIATLPEKQKLVFNMKYFDDMSYDQMSEALGTSVGALKASFFHAVRKIEEFITKQNG